MYTIVKAMVVQNVCLGFAVAIRGGEEDRRRGLEQPGIGHNDVAVRMRRLPPSPRVIGFPRLPRSGVIALPALPPPGGAVGAAGEIDLEAQPLALLDSPPIPLSEELSALKSTLARIFGRWYPQEYRVYEITKRYWAYWQLHLLVAKFHRKIIFGV